MVAAAPFLAMNFLGRPLAFMMVYVWGRCVVGPTEGVVLYAYDEPPTSCVSIDRSLLNQKVLTPGGTERN